MKSHLPQILITCCSAFLLAGCVSSKSPPPLRSAANFRPEQMDKVYIMPTVDARVDRTLKTDFNTIIQQTTREYLMRQGYQAALVTDAAQVSAMTIDDIREAAPDWVKRTGPPESRWVMIFAIEDLARQELNLGATGNAVIVLVVLDRQRGEVVWRDKALGRVGEAGSLQNGLVGMIIEGLISRLQVDLMAGSAVRVAMSELLWKFPKKNGN